MGLTDDDVSASHKHALLNTVDVNARHSKHAQTIVEGFRRGIYANDVKFYVANLAEWIDHHQRARHLATEKD